MPRSAATAGPTAVQDKPQGPPVPGAKDSTALPNRATGAAGLKRGGARANSPMSELAQLITEPAHGANYGRRASDNPEAEGRHLPLGADDWQAAEFMRAGGWTIVHAKDGARAGVLSHGVNQYTVLHPEEHVDHGALQAMVEHELGFTYEQVRSVYRQGPLAADQRELRGSIDARLLALSRAGGNMAELGRALGFPIKDDGHCRVMENALTRAREEER